MKFLHTMVRITDIEESLSFYCGLLGLEERRRKEVPEGKFTLIFLGAPGDEAEIELTYNWDSDEEYGRGRNFGHLAFEVDDIYEICSRALERGIEINVPPRNGRMAFFRSPDDISIELLQKGEPKAPQSPWKEMENSGWW